MKISRHINTLALVIVAVFVMGGYGQNRVAFNIDKAENVIPKEIFGVLMERLGRQWNGNGAIWVGTNSDVPNTSGMRQDVIDAFIECGVGAAEWPGGCAANGYNWKNENSRSNNMSVDEFIEFCELTGAEPVICGRPMASDAQDNYDFAEYIINDLGYPLKWFKVGNEVWGCGGNQNVNGYTNNYSANYDLLKGLKDTEKGKQLLIAAGNDMEGRWNWVPTLLNNVGDDMDGIEYHDYIYHPDNIPSRNPSTSNYWTIMGNVFMNDLQPNLVDRVFPPLDSYDPEKRIKVILDEWGNWLIDVGGGDDWMQENTVMDAVAAGASLNMFVHMSERIAVACLAQGVNVIQSLVNINTSGQMVKTTTFYVFKMYIPHHINNAKFAPITSSNYGTANGNIQAMNAAASVDDSGTVNISITNADLSNREIAVSLTSSVEEYTVRSAEVVTGAEISSGNRFGQEEEVNIKPLESSNYELDGKTLNVTMPSKSVVMIRLTPAGIIGTKSGNSLNRNAGAFAINVNPQGKVYITSSVKAKTPIFASLFSADGKTLIDKSSRTLRAGTKTNLFEKKTLGNGVYFVRISGANINLTKKVIVVKEDGPQ